MFDAYLKIDGIPGECQEENHKEWIQLLSYSHAVLHRGTNLGGGGARGSSGKAEHQDFRFSKYVDKATPKLNLHCVNGVNLKKVTLEIGIDGLVPAWHSEYCARLIDGALYFAPAFDPAGPLFKLTKKGLTASSDFDGMCFGEQ